MDTLTSAAAPVDFPARAGTSEARDGVRPSSKFRPATLIRGAALPLADIVTLFLVLPIVSTVALTITFDPQYELVSFTSRFLSLWLDTVVISLLVGMLLWVCGHYTERPSLWCETRQLAAACGLASLMIVLWPFSGFDLLSRLVISAGWLIMPLCMLVMRQAVREGLSRAGRWRVPVVVIAEPEATDWVERALNSRCPADFNVVKTLALDGVGDSWTDQSWRSLLTHCQASRLIVAITPGKPGHDQLLKSVVRSRVPFMVLFDSGELPVFGIHQTRALGSDAVLLSYRTGQSRQVMRLTKIAIDVCVAGVLLVILAPLMVLLSVLVALDGGPMLFAQERVGENGKRFRCLKFRTMSVDADSILRQTLANDPIAAQEWADTRKLRVDPRVTPLGVFLRKTSLDELPQLFNVLQLKMSLVGPRPIVQDEITRYAEDIAFYYETRPGLTGLWQVSGRSNTTYEQRIAYDRWYVKNWTLWHDIVILIMTVPALMTRRGAR